MRNEWRMIKTSSNARLADRCGSILHDPVRLAALEATRQIGSPREESFDRLTRLASKILHAPLAIVSFIGEDKQFFKSFHGLPEPWATQREIPIHDSVCQYALTGEPLLIEDARIHELLKGNPAVPALNLVAYMGIPMITPEGHNLGTFCVIDYKPRQWTQDEVSVLKELTAAIMTEIGLKMALDKMDRDRKLRDRLIATLTHDLRSPLSTIKLGAEVIAMASPDNESISSVARRISRGVNHADQMIQTLLDAATIQAGEKLSLNLDILDLSELLMLALDDLIAVHGERFPSSVPAHVLGKWDRMALRRTFDNLVSNAIKYGDAGRPITIRLEDRGGDVELSVHNEGNPLSAEERDFIFEPYRRTASARIGNQTGWGLGLVSAQGVVAAHGGRIRVESDAVRGTIFFINLPKDPPASAA
jgi:signal transduction histidine kinase